MRGLPGYLRMELRSITREPLAALLALSIPAANYVLFGLLFPSGPGGDYYERYTPSAIGLVILTIALFSLAPQLVIQREQGIFKRLLVTPLDPRAIVIATISRTMVIVLIGLVEMVLVGYFLFQRALPQHVGQFLIAVLVSSASIFALAFLVGAIFKRGSAAFGAAALLFQPMLFLSGAAMPLEVLPPAVQQVSQVVPMTYAVALLRLSWVGELFTMEAIVPVVVLVLVFVACLLAGARTFRWTATSG